MPAPQDVSVDADAGVTAEVPGSGQSPQGRRSGCCIQHEFSDSWAIKAAAAATISRGISLVPGATVEQSVLLLWHSSQSDSISQDDLSQDRSVQCTVSTEPVQIESLSSK